MMRKPYCDKEGINKGTWTKQEDQKLIERLLAFPPQGLHRCGKSCRLRWINYLRPDLKRGNFAQDEEELIIKLHALLGNRWSLIAGRLQGRTDNEVKNYWNSLLKKKLLNMGIDPNNHKVNQIPSPQQQNHVATIVVSMSDEDACKPKAASVDNNDKMSGSCLEDETSASAGSCNLNLGITIAVLSPPLTLVDEEKPKNATNEIKSDELTTLLLFG